MVYCSLEARSDPRVLWIDGRSCLVTANVKQERLSAWRFGWGNCEPVRKIWTVLKAQLSLGGQWKVWYLKSASSTVVSTLFFTCYNCYEVLVMGLAMDTITPFCSTSAIDRTSDSDKVLDLFVRKMEMSHWFHSLSVSLFPPCRPILWAPWPRNNLQSWLFVGQSKMVPLAWCVLDTCAYLWVLIIIKSRILEDAIFLQQYYLISWNSSVSGKNRIQG